MDYSQSIGIDVSKDYLDFALYQNHQSIYLKRVPNQVSALQNYLEGLSKSYPLKNTLFCLETTGVYTQPFLVVSLQMEAHVWLESALEIKQSLGIKRSKNDILDAQEIAEYAFRRQDKARIYEAPTQILEQIKSLLSLRNRLLNAQKSLQVPLREAEKFQSKHLADLLNKCNDQTIKGIQEDLKQIEQELICLLNQDESLKKNFELIRSVVGVGKWTALEILHSTQNFSKFDYPKPYASYCGVVPFAKSSGKKKFKSRVSQLANKKMKCLLHMCALSAVRNDEEIKLYYERKIKEGKPKLTVLNAIRNKIILRIFAVIKKQEKYEKKELENLECS